MLGALTCPASPETLAALALAGDAGSRAGGAPEARFPKAPAQFFTT